MSLLFLFAGSVHAQAVIGNSCPASGQNAITANGTPVICTGSPLVWTAVGGSGGGLTSVTSLPATCTPGVTAPVNLTVAPFGVYYCITTNIWAQGAAGTASTNFIRTSPNCNNGQAGNSGTCYFVNGNVKSIYDASTTNASSTITCPNSDCNFTQADVGKLVWATNLAKTGFTSFQSFSVICPQTTIQTVNSATSITLAAANDCTATTTAANLIWGTDDTTNLQNAWNAVIGVCLTGNPGVLTFDDVGMLTQSAIFINAPVSCVSASGAENPRGISIIGNGLSSRIVATPNFNLASCTGPDGTGNACFGWGQVSVEQSGGLYFRDWIISGPPFNGIATNFKVIWMPSDATMINFGCSGFGAQSTNGIGIYIKSFNASIGTSFFDGCGGTAAAENDSGSTGILNLWGQDFFGDVAGHNGFWNNSGIVFSNGTSFGGGAASGFSSVVLTTGTFFSDSDAFYCPNGASSNVLNLNGSGTTAYISHGVFAPNSGGACGASFGGIVVNGSGSAGLHLSQSIVNATGTALTVAANNRYFDECGNSFTGTISISGTRFGTCSDVGTACATGNFALTSGWGTSSVTSVAAGGDNHGCHVTITGAAGSAGPVLTWTYPTVPLVAPPSCHLIGTTASLTGVQVGTPGATNVAFTFVGTPTTVTYQFDVGCP